MTEEDAFKWAQQSGHEIERVAANDNRAYSAFG